MTIDLIVQDVTGFLDRMEQQFEMMIPKSYEFDIRYKMIHSYKDYFRCEYGGK